MLSNGVTNDKVVLDFMWLGPNMLNGGSSCGGLDIGMIDLVFNKELKTEFKVLLSDNINEVALRKLPLLCRKFGDPVNLGHQRVMPLLSETHPEFLRVSQERIRSLEIVAHFFKKITPITIGDPLKRTTIQEQSIDMSNKNVQLKCPEEIDNNQRYSIVVTSSHDLSLSAYLVKAGDNPPIEDNQEGVNSLREIEKEETIKTEIEKKYEELLIKQELNILESENNDSSTHLELGQLTLNQLQSLLEISLKKDEEWQLQRLRCMHIGDTDKLDTVVLKNEFVNQRLLKHLIKAVNDPR